MRASHLFLLPVAFLPVTGSAAAVDFAKEVLPVLQRSCFECHGAEQQKGGLRIDSRAALLKGGKGGPVVKTGHPDESELLRRISLPRSDKQAMPKRGEALKPAEMAAIQQWIAAGAVWPDEVNGRKHWSYVKPERSALPKTRDQTWSKNAIDRFILARLEKEGMRPSPSAEPAVLLRRLSLDLTGLPPSVAEVTAFERACNAPAADVEKAVAAEVDRLLASEEFGVRWARPWLDLARYADSHGFQRDDLREIWGYRDWVVTALNAGMPFDQFTIEQLAGDLLPNATPNQIVATGFHRCTPTNVEAGTEPEESRINQVIDRVNTTGAVWLGSTLECAQCHNHKYDPFSQRDYYSLLAYFNNTEKEAERTNPKAPGSIQFAGVPFVMPNPSADAERQRLQAALDAVGGKIAARQKVLAETRPTPSASPSGKEGTSVLRLIAFDAESGVEHEMLADGSLLVATGDVPDTDTYNIELELPAGPLSAIRLDTLTHESLPGNGPGRGSAERPNFVLQQLKASIAAADGKQTAVPLRFDAAFASFSQSTFQVEGLIAEPQTGWAINPRFGEDHWCVLAFDEPLTIAVGTKLKLSLVQKYGGGRVIGRLKVAGISGDVAAALPETTAEPKPVVAKKRRKGKAAADEEPAPRSKDPELAKLEKQQAALQRELKALKPQTSEVMRELDQPRMTAIFKRGVYTDPTEPVTAATPAIFDAKGKGPPNRLTLAKWLVSRDNPLTARVTVNRWWAELFGQGIVTTVEDFGIKGASPTHPELLDWLAVDFMDSGWDIKALLRTIVMSATYRQAAGDNKGLAPQEYALRTSLYGQGPRFRLDAEAVRDNALAISGLISLKKGGEPIRPPQPDGLWAKVGGQQYKYEISPGTEKYRRGLYVVLKRGAPYPSFVNFDASARMACVVKRSRSNTPLQALTLLNDPVYVEATKAFASRVIREAPSNDLDVRLRHAFRTAVARLPRDQEASVLKQLWEAQYEAAKADAAATKLLVAGLVIPESVTPAEFAAWYSVASAILNLDECITKG